jgi:hypothetical protein
LPPSSFVRDPARWVGAAGQRSPADAASMEPEHDPEKCVAVFGKDHARVITF